MGKLNTGEILINSEGLKYDEKDNSYMNRSQRELRESTKRKTRGRFESSNKRNDDLNISNELDQNNRSVLFYEKQSSTNPDEMIKGKREYLGYKRKEPYHYKSEEDLSNSAEENNNSEKEGDEIEIEPFRNFVYQTEYRILDEHVEKTFEYLNKGYITFDNKGFTLNDFDLFQAEYNIPLPEVRLANGLKGKMIKFKELSETEDQYILSYSMIFVPNCYCKEKPFLKNPLDIKDKDHLQCIDNYFCNGFTNLDTLLLTEKFIIENFYWLPVNYLYYKLGRHFRFIYSNCFKFWASVNDIEDKTYIKFMEEWIQYYESMDPEKFRESLFVKSENILNNNSTIIFANADYNISENNSHITFQRMEEKDSKRNSQKKNDDNEIPKKQKDQKEKKSGKNKRIKKEPGENGNQGNGGGDRKSNKKDYGDDNNECTSESENISENEDGSNRITYDKRNKNYKNLNLIENKTNPGLFLPSSDQVNLNIVLEDIQLDNLIEMILISNKLGDSMKIQDTTKKIFSLIIVKEIRNEEEVLNILDPDSNLISLYPSVIKEINSNKNNEINIPEYEIFYFREKCNFIYIIYYRLQKELFSNYFNKYWRRAITDYRYSKSN